MTMVIRGMRDTICLSSRFSWLALACVCAIQLAWAAPMMIVSSDLPEFLQRSQDHQASESTDESTEAEDASDDPVMLVSNNETGFFPVTFALKAYQIIEGTWSPTSPVRPPNDLRTI